MHLRYFSVVGGAIALKASTCQAFTPPGFTPHTSNNLTVVFGSLLAVDGVYVHETDAASAPSLYTDEHLSGLYTLMMFDPDNPPPANSTSTQTQEFLHWIQPGLVSSNTSTIVNGKQVYELLNPWNVSALAPYLEPGPPFKFPYFHRYIELLLYTPTQNSSVLYQAAQSRSPFHAQQVITDANLTVVAGNWFNSSNPQALIGNPSGNASITPTQTGGPAAVSTSSAGKLEGLKWATEYMILLYIAGWLLL